MTSRTESRIDLNGAIPIRISKQAGHIPEVHHVVAMTGPSGELELHYSSVLFPEASLPVMRTT